MKLTLKLFTKQKLIYTFILSLMMVTSHLSAQDPFGAQQSQGSLELKAFVMSCTYGVLAGALVGAATLAFTENPSDHLRNVAKGASLGLYAGIFLGVYVVYLVPDQMEKRRKEEEDQLGAKNHLIYPDISIKDGKPEYTLSALFSF